MALKNDFYNEIFEQEKKWIDLINHKLLNSIYCNLTLKPFYIEKRKELEKEYNLTNNIIIGQFITIIDNIINQIELFNKQYNQFEDVNISSLIPLFLTTQMNNVSQKNENTIKSENTKEDNEIARLQIKKQILENKIQNYNKNFDNMEDYVYDDFPDEEDYGKRKAA